MIILFIPAKMSPARRHTVSDVKLLRELEEGKKSKSPSSRVKKIAREYSRLSKEGHLTRGFKSFTSPSGMLAWVTTFGV